MFRVHQLVAIVFLNHKPCGHKLVIDHIDSNSLNNNLNNLRLVTNRENTSKEKTIKKGLPACVYLHKPNNKYRVRIRINGKNTHLGYFKNILDAENAYFKKLNKIKIMGASKNLFLMLQEQSVETNNFLPSKKEIQLSAKSFVSNLLDAGTTDKMELYAQSVRINEALQIVTDELKNSIPQENFEAFGIKGTYRSGGETLNYKEDLVYAELEAKLKERAELIKVATKSKDTIYDSEGVEVTKVSSTQRKSSLAISF
jgi:hypothetical protein